MKKYMCLVVFILVGGDNAYAQWRCDDWGAWMMDWGVAFWIQPITLMVFLFATVAVIAYIVTKITRSA